MPFNITIAHDSTTTHSSSRSSSPITDDGEDSSGTGVRVSPTSAAGSQEYTDSLEETEGWVLPVYPDEIGPSDSASRPRTSNQHRPLVEAPRPEAARRQPSRRQVGHDRVHHHSHPRAHRPPPPIAPESVDPNEEWREAFYGRGPPQHPPRAYAHWGHVAGNSAPNYAPSHSSAQAYSAFPTSSLNPPTQQLVPFASPISGYGYSHYQAAPGGSAPGYFPPPHHGGPSIGNHMGAHGGAPYSGQEMVPHPSAAYYPYGLQGYSMAQPMAPPAIYHYPTVYSPPSTTPPPPVDNSKDDEKFARLEKILMDQKAEQDAKEAAAKKAAEDQVAEAVAKKKIADEIAAAASAAAAAATSEAEKKAAEEAAKNKAAAEEKAAADKAAAEKAAEEKAAADKAAAEKAAAEKAAAEIAAAEKAAADKAVAEAAAAAAAAVAAATPPPPPPPPEEKKKPIKFKDAVGRKFSFPFHLCNTWMGMEDLIRQAFLHVELIGPHVAEGHYDLVGPNGEIILPQVWETMIEPDWIITMHMWPMPEPPPPKAEELPPAEPPPLEVPPPPPVPDPVPETIVIVPPDPKKKKPQTRLTPFQVWAGGKAGKKSLKVLKKPEEAIQHDILCRVM